MPHSDETEAILAACRADTRRELLDRFAMAALTGLLARADVSPDSDYSDCEDVALFAYELADAMMQEREKPV